MKIDRTLEIGWRGAILLGTLSSVGCVHYVPVEVAELRPQEEVHVRVDQDGAVKVMQQLGRFAPEVRATVEPKGADSTALTIWVGRDYPGTPFQDVHQTIVLPQDDVTALLRRELSVWRSAVTAAGITALFIWATDRIFQWLPNRQTEGDIPPPPGDDDETTFSRLGPGWSFRIPFGLVP